MSQKNVTPPADLQTLLGEDHPPRWWKRGSLWFGLGALLIVAGGVYYWQAQSAGKAAPTYVTAELRTGSLTLSRPLTPCCHISGFSGRCKS